MGYYLHARKINRIEYGSSLFSAATADLIMDILRNFSDNSWENESETQIEIPKEDFKDGLEGFKKQYPDEETFAKAFPALIQNGYDRDRTINTLQCLYDEADPQNEYVYLEWF